MVIRLVGGQEIRPPSEGTAGHLRFLARTLPTLISGNWNTGRDTRCLGFQGTVPENGELDLLAVDVDSIGPIPPGMVAWEISGSSLSILGAGSREPIAEAHVTWDWLEQTPGSPRPWIGEPVISDRATDLPSRLRLTSLSWITGDASPAADEVILKQYDPSWTAQFREFERWLQETLGDVALRIEHYGSTAIPGMPAKPVIDVLVEVSDFTQAKRRILSLLNIPRWEYWWYIDHPMFIRRSTVSGKRTHHVHLATHEHRLWEGIRFRDYLRAHPDDAAEYAELKLRSAVTFRDNREAYTDAKEAFIKKISASSKGG